MELDIEKVLGDCCWQAEGAKLCSLSTRVEPLCDAGTLSILVVSRV